jgi:hypothetical protein
LADVDAKLSRMSSGGSEFSKDLWLELALHTDNRWEDVRGIARAALLSFGWALESPPQDPGSRGTTYVPGGA